MRPLTVLLGLLLASGASASSTSALRVLADCVAAKPTARGLEHLQSSCPALEQALIDLGFSEQLEGNWRERISAASLRDLLILARRYEAQPPSEGPRVSALPAILRALDQPTASQSWWERFKTWLRSWLRGAEAGDAHWLSRLLPGWKVAPWLGRAIGYALIACVIALALLFMSREIKAARTQRRPPAERSPAGVARRRQTPPSVESDAATLDLPALPPAQRPAALLSALVRLLRRAERLMLERSLTHRQLGARAVFDDDTQRQRFVRLALLAERQLYGAQTEAGSAALDPESARVLSDGLALHAQLLTTAGERR